MRGAQPFTYWKRPWHQWVVLGAAVVQVWALNEKILTYRRIQGAGVLTASEWENYAMQQQFSCMITALLAVIFTGVFLIGIFAKSKQAADLANCILWLCISAALTISLFVLRPPISGIGFMWLLIWIIALSASIYSIYLYQRKKHKPI